MVLIKHGNVDGSSCHRLDNISGSQYTVVSLFSSAILMSFRAFMERQTYLHLPCAPVCLVEFHVVPSLILLPWLEALD